jgi:hypothetical protein
MLTLTEIVYAVRGLSLLARFDARGLEYFDRSIQGFWRSFQVAVLVAPVHAFVLGTVLPSFEPTVSWQQILIIVIVFYIINWFIYPVVAFEICRILKKEAEYVGFIAVYNWLALLGAAADLVITTPEALGVWDSRASTGIGYLVYIALLALSWFVARHSLRIAGSLALGFVFIGFAIDIILVHFMAAMLK